MLRFGTRAYLYNIARGIVLLTAVLAVTLVIANLVDWRRYTRAVRFEQFVGIERVRELSRTCFDLGKNGYVKLTEYPPIIAELKPRWVSIDREYAQIGLYGHGDASVFLVFSKYGENEVVTVCDYLRGMFDERPIYIQDPVKYESLHPKNRIVTLGEGTMHEYVEWIVLPDEIRVVAQPGSGGPAILGSSPLPIETRLKIEAALRQIPEVVRGKRFHSGVMDGTTLRVGFEADGRRGETDIVLDNTWRDEVGQLVELIATASLGDRPLRFREIMKREVSERPRDQYTTTWPEQQKLDQPQLPWWCLWPRL